MGILRMIKLFGWEPKIAARLSREEGARAALHQDTPDFEFDQRKHQVGASSFFHNLSNVII
jgi:hypothetical protein